VLLRRTPQRQCAIPATFLLHCTMRMQQADGVMAACISLNLCHFRLHKPPLHRNARRSRSCNSTFNAGDTALYMLFC